MMMSSSSSSAGTREGSEASILKIAVLQSCSSGDMKENIRFVELKAEEAKEKGAQILFTAENVSRMSNSPDRLYEQPEHPALIAFSDLAKRLKMWIHIGSLHIKLPLDSEPFLANRSFLLDDKGSIRSQYDKIHLFDARVEKNGGGEGGEKEINAYQESKRFVAGEKAQVADSPWGRIGMTICYDLRFPHLFRHLAKEGGAQIIAVPSAFTVPTGRDHWHSLLRSRAIENSVFIVAAAQSGFHPSSRRSTFGHSLVVDPWGRILHDSLDNVDVSVLSLDLNLVTECRSLLPSIFHDRPFLPVSSLSPPDDTSEDRNSV